MWRHHSVFNRRTPTITTLKPLPSEVGVMVGVVDIGHCSKLSAFCRVRYGAGCWCTNANTNTRNVKVVVFSRWICISSSIL